MSDASGGDEGKRELLDGIGRDAAAEAQTLVKQAEEAAAGKARLAAAQAAGILDEARAKSRVAVQAIERQATQAATVETRRIGLKVREQVSRRVLSETAKRLGQMVGEPAYRDVLKGWVVEAALGLSATEADVLASAPEMALMDDRFLAEASARAGELAGHPVRLARSRAKPTEHQGVILTSKDGRTAYNNLVPTRLGRKQAQIRKLIYASLRGGE